MSKRVNNAKGTPSRNKSRDFQYRFLRAERDALIKDATEGKHVGGFGNAAIRAISKKLRKLAPTSFRERRRGIR